MTAFNREKILAPADQRLLEIFTRIKPLARAMQTLSRERYEKYFYLAALAGGAPIDDANFPQLYRLARECGEKFALEPPEIFVYHDSAPTAKLIGDNPPRLLIADRALEKLAAPQLQCLIAHTLAHLPCGHFPYLAARDLLAVAADNLGIFKAPAAIPQALFAEWRYAAELSCDRAALWALGDTDAMLDFFSAAALPTDVAAKFGGKLLPKALLAQGEKFLAQRQSAAFCPVFSAWSNLYLALPRYALRAVELKKWADSVAYAELRGGDTNAGAAENGQDAPAYWGAFAGDWRDWEKALTGETAETFPSEKPAAAPANSLTELTETAARAAIQAASRATDFFFAALKK